MIIDSIAGDVLIEAAGCSDVAAGRAIAAAAAVFCERTKCWRAPFSSKILRGEIGLEEGDGFYTVGVENVFVDGRRARPVTPSQFADGRQGFMLTDDALRINYGMRAAGDFILAPTYDASELPDLLRRHLAAVQAGALARLLAQSGTPWFRPDIAQLRTEQFEQAIVEASSRLQRGSVGAAIRTRGSFL